MVGTRNRLAWPMVSSDFWRDMHTLSGNGDTNGQSLWRPAATVSEGDEAFVVRLEIPGVASDTLEVDLDGEFLTVAGERPEPVAGEGYRILMAEVPWGRFHRRFRLGSQVDRDAISATYREGLLEITAPKRQEARPRRIVVSTEA